MLNLKASRNHNTNSLKENLKAGMQDMISRRARVYPVHTGVDATWRIEF
jgi:hypothetical protein